MSRSRTVSTSTYVKDETSELSHHLSKNTHWLEVTNHTLLIPDEADSRDVLVNGVDTVTEWFGRFETWLLELKEKVESADSEAEKVNSFLGGEGEYDIGDICSPGA
jgi:hypothetical protein